MNWFVRKKTKGDSQLRALLNQWEQQTLIGSEYSFRQQYSVALKYFKRAEEIAMQARQSFPDNEDVLQYYALSSLNLAHVCQCQALDQKTEQVLADAHFNMTAVMMDANKTLGIRQLARSQAAVILNSLVHFLKRAGRGHVACDLEEEFGRLSGTVLW